MLSILFQEHSSNQRLFYFFRIKTLSAFVPLYECGISNINSFINGVFDKNGLKLGFVVEGTKKLDFF